MSKLANFLIRLTEDPALKVQYKSDPDAVIRAAGLTPEEGMLIKNQDVEAVQARIGEGYALEKNSVIKAYRK